MGSNDVNSTLEKETSKEDLAAMEKIEAIAVSCIYLTNTHQNNPKEEEEYKKMINNVSEEIRQNVTEKLTVEQMETCMSHLPEDQAETVMELLQKDMFEPSHYDYVFEGF